MKDKQTSERPAADAQPQDGAREAQPWHAADEKPASGERRSVPIGTHSLTGGGASVGMPAAPQAQSDAEAERSSPREAPPGSPEPDPLAEPRANLGEILGRKP